MPRLLSCPRGHRWEESDESVARGDSLSCPECGAPVPLTVIDASTVGAAPSATAPTVAQTESWVPLSLTAAFQQPPPTLPEFEILEEIGRGGMGIVYRARQLSDQHVVAIKVIRKDRLQHEEAVRRFRREAQAAARLSHPNIVTVCDFDRAGDTHYLVMEYVDGITLERQVEREGPLSVAQACDFIRQAALGLQHAHEQALVHRDIKPSNLMIMPTPTAGDASSSSYRIKLLDMGVARVLQLGGQGIGDSLSTLTQGGAVIGTADYVAPEQLEDPHGADIRADLYSLGCTFYYLLTGRVPFPGGTLLSKLDKQRWHSPTPIETLRGDVPPAVAHLVEKLMEKKPADRFETPGDLADAIELLAKHGYEEPPLPRIELREMRRLIGHADAVWTVRFAPDGQQVASAGRDGSLIYWEAATGQIVRKLPKHPHEIRAIAFHPTGEPIATASGFTIRLYDIRGQELRRISGHTGSIRALAFSPDGKRLATGGDDKTIRLWDFSTGREVQRFSRHTQGITALVFVPQANLLASASRDQSIRLWDLRSGLEVEQFDAQAGNVLDVAVSPDGKLLASAHFDTIIRLWDRETGKPIGQFIGHKQMVSALAFTREGDRLLSVSQDQTLRLWDIETRQELACAAQAGGINTLSVSPTGDRVVIGGADRSVVVLSLPLA